MIKQWIQFDHSLDKAMLIAQDILLLVLRCWIAWVFLKSGLLKYQSWETTLVLFEYEYTVPLLSAKVAALMGTSAELLLPPLVMLGFVARPAAFALFLVNIVAVISYPDISQAGIKDHQLWGLGLLWITLLGAGRISGDKLLSRWVKGH